MNKKQLGDLGETLACNFLKKKGYKIVDRNFRIRGGEIDIIVKKDDVLTFVEVKTRTSNQFGTPEEAVTPFKVHFLRRAIAFYCQQYEITNMALGLDAVVIDLDNKYKLVRIEHLENII